MAVVVVEVFMVLEHPALVALEVVVLVVLVLVVMEQQVLSIQVVVEAVLGLAQQVALEARVS
jgi:hypothetical protein